jgi:hypothetical protein
MGVSEVVTNIGQFSPRRNPRRAAQDRVRYAEPRGFPARHRSRRLNKRVEAIGFAVDAWPNSRIRSCVAHRLAPGETASTEIRPESLSARAWRAARGRIPTRTILLFQTPVARSVWRYRTPQSARHFQSESRRAALHDGVAACVVQNENVVGMTNPDAVR